MVDWNQAQEREQQHHPLRLPPIRISIRFWHQTKSEFHGNEALIPIGRSSLIYHNLPGIYIGRDEWKKYFLLLLAPQNRAQSWKEKGRTGCLCGREKGSFKLQSNRIQRLANMLAHHCYIHSNLREA